MDTLTIHDLVNAYLNKYAYKRCKTAPAIEATINKHVKPLFSKKLVDITLMDAEALHQQIGKTSPIQSNRVIQAMKAAWNKGIKWQMCIAPNPFALIEHFPEKINTRRLSPSEVQRLFFFLKQKRNADLHDFVLLSLFTGVRRTNVLSMRWDDLDLIDGLWMIPTTKNGTPQLVPLGLRELEILRSRLNKSEWVFPSKRGTGHTKWLYKSWRSLLVASGIKYATFHDLRRSLAAAMADLNVSATIIQGAMNHKSLVTTMKVYAIAGKGAELEARQRVQDLWFSKAV